MQKYIKKADVLIEALPYLQAFKEKVFVIKYGGTALLNKEVRPLLLQDIIFLNTVGIKPVLVHGGSPLINKEIRKSGESPKFVDGVRVTDEECIKTVINVLGDLNSDLVKQLEKYDGKAKPIIGENAVVETEPISEELGYVGKVTNIKIGTLTSALREGIIPVISPLGKDSNGDIYNVNADLVSAEVAGALNATKLVFLTHVEGILRDTENEDTLISSLYIDEVERLIKENIIRGGMIPKVKAGCDTISKGVSKVHIIDGNLPHTLLLEIFTEEGIGTQILERK